MRKLEVNSTLPHKNTDNRIFHRLTDRTWICKEQSLQYADESDVVPVSVSTYRNRTIKAAKNSRPVSRFFRTFGSLVEWTWKNEEICFLFCTCCIVDGRLQASGRTTALSRFVPCSGASRQCTTAPADDGS